MSTVVDLAAKFLLGVGIGFVGSCVGYAAALGLERLRRRRR